MRQTFLDRCVAKELEFLGSERVELGRTWRRRRRRRLRRCARARRQTSTFCGDSAYATLCCCIGRRSIGYLEKGHRCRSRSRILDDRRRRRRRCWRWRRRRVHVSHDGGAREDPTALAGLPCASQSILSRFCRWLRAPVCPWVDAVSSQEGKMCAPRNTTLKS